MKKNFVGFIFILLWLSASGDALYAQANKAVITSKTVTVRRKDIEKDSLKAEFTIIYPQIKIPGNRSVEDKIRQKLDYEKVFEISVKEDGEDYWNITSLYFKTIYNNSGFLDVRLFYETLGAYPWTNEEELIFDLKTGETISAADCFKQSAMENLAKQVRKKLLAEIRQAKRKYGGFPPESENGEYDASNLDNFSIGARGITFHYDYGFNYASLAFQPKGDFFFTYSQLKPFIRRDGLLAKFVR